MKVAKQNIFKRSGNLLGYSHFMLEGKFCVFIIPKIGTQNYKCADIRYTYTKVSECMYPVLRAFALQDGCVTECTLIGNYKVAMLYTAAERYGYTDKDFVAIELGVKGSTVEEGQIIWCDSRIENAYSEAKKMMCENFYDRIGGRYILIGKDTDTFKKKVEGCRKIVNDTNISVRTEERHELYNGLEAMLTYKLDSDESKAEADTESNNSVKKTLPSFTRFIRGGIYCTFIVPKIGTSYYRCFDMKYTYNGASDNTYSAVRAFALNDNSITECILVVNNKVVESYCVANDIEFVDSDFVAIELGTKGNNVVDGRVLDCDLNMRESYYKSVASACENFYDCVPTDYKIIKEGSDSFKDKVETHNSESKKVTDDLASEIDSYVEKHNLDSALAAMSNLNLDSDSDTENTGNK